MKTWEMIKKLTENPELKFVQTETRYEKLTAFVSGGFLDVQTENGKDRTPEHNFILDTDEWELIPQPVTFMEAVNSEKKIKYETWSIFYTLDEVFQHLLFLTHCEIRDKMNEKRWLIQED